MGFKGLRIQHLERTLSDHHPILVSDSLENSRTKFTGFCFLNAWFHHPKFISSVEKFWKKEPRDLGDVMEEFKSNLQVWNEKTFGNIFQGKNL